MRFNVINLGCKVNRVESDSVAAFLLTLGWQQSKTEDADLVVVNTCAVTGEAEKKTRKAVRHAINLNSVAPIVVTGCSVALTPNVYLALDERVKVLLKPELMIGIKEIVERLVDQSSHKPKCSESSRLLIVPQASLAVGDEFRTRVGVKIQDGCNNACTFCVVHVARGKSISVPSGQIIEECIQLGNRGVREIVLTGINLGCYRDCETDLSRLIEILLEKTSHCDGPGSYPPRFRIGSIEPLNVTNTLIDLMAKSDGRVARHLHLPLQSGSSKVLREMARPYSASRFLDLVDTLRENVPSIALSTDIIAGFPGETEEDFEDTLDVARQSRFMKIHVFPYSKREGTPAAKRDDQVEDAIKTTRSKTLRELSIELAREDMLSRAGTTELALVEGDGRATLESYHEVRVRPDAPKGALIPFAL